MEAGGGGSSAAARLGPERARRWFRCRPKRTAWRRLAPSSPPGRVRVCPGAGMPADPGRGAGWWEWEGGGERLPSRLSPVAAALGRLGWAAGRPDAGPAGATSA